MPKRANLSLRNQKRGGGPIDIGTRTRFATEARPRRVLLVHGYNVSQRQAEKAFEKFEESLYEFAKRLADDCCWVFWPGDAPIPFIRTIAYYRKLKNAKACAPEFAEYLKELSPAHGEAPHVIIIGHSLGCRLILEALGLLAQQQREEALKINLKIEIILMAAAVPITLLFEGGSLREAAFQSTRRMVMYSRYDSVLRDFFAIGQRLGRDGLGCPLEAVGRFGLPSIGVWTGKYELYHYDHSHYWKTPGTAHLIASWLGAANAPRSIASRMSLDKPRPSERLLATIRPFPEAREIAERRVS